MPIDKRYESWSASDWDAFARAWMEELRGPGAPPEKSVSGSVVMMNFTATAAQQWQFILAAVAHAQSDGEFGRIAAGPIEHLLGHHGQEYIGEVERLAEVEPKFARMMTFVWRYMMTEEVWARVQALKSRVQS